MLKDNILKLCFRITKNNILFKHAWKNIILCHFGLVKVWQNSIYRIVDKYGRQEIKNCYTKLVEECETWTQNKQNRFLILAKMSWNAAPTGNSGTKAIIKSNVSLITIGFLKINLTRKCGNSFVLTEITQNFNISYLS